MPRRATHLPLLVLLGACGGDTTTEPGATAFTELDPAPGAGTWTSESAQALGAAPDAVGIDGDQHLVVLAGGMAHVEAGGALEPRPLYAGPDEPATMGAPRAVRARAGGGAWIATASGLFVLDRHFVARSPLSDALTDIQDVGHVGSGPLAGLWAIDADGAWWRAADNLQSVQVDLRTPRWVAVESRGRFGVLASTDDLVLLGHDGGLTALDVELPTGEIRGLAADDGAVWVGASNGLFKTDGSAWTRYPLSSKPVDALASDPATDAVWAKSGAELFRIEGETITRFPAGQGESQIAVDRLGDVHALSAAALFKRGTGATNGSAVTFADVRPWLAANCSQCHQNQTADFEVYEVFVERAEPALARVRSGDMPRCAGSVRCADEDRLSPADYAVLEQWIRDGMPE